MNETKNLPVTTRLDNELAEEAVHAIEWLTTVPPEKVRVTARDGWLYLAGEVDWSHQRNTIEEVVHHLPGVRGVQDSIRVRLSPAPGEEAALSRHLAG